MQLYYCEVCFAVPLPQCFTYTYQAKPWKPETKSRGKDKEGKSKAQKTDPQSNKSERLKESAQQSEQELSEPLLYPKLGQRIFASFGRGRKEGWIISASQEPPESLQQAIAAGKLELAELKELEIAEPVPLFGPHELSLARWIARYYICSLGEALNCILPTGKKEKEPLLCDSPVVAGDVTEPVLSAEQEVAVAAVCHSNPPPFYYLFGPTGSGKTEVFLHCMAHVLQQGKSVIYLVPEISLCYQLQEQLQHRFRQPVALLHSHLSAEMRLWYWRSLQQGDCQIVLGARSAVFAPVRELGLIVLDEEHEQSYKAGDTPRYHARQVAMRRCRDRKAILLMGSATPSVEAMHSANFSEMVVEPALNPPPETIESSELPEDLNFSENQNFPDYLPDFIKWGREPRREQGRAAELKVCDGAKEQKAAGEMKDSLAVASGSIEMLRLSKRLAGGCFPEVEIVDLRSSKTIISDVLVREIETVVSRGDQAILFLNRRGYSPIVECFSCGKVQECRNCSVALAYHKNLGRLKCHHCGFSMQMISCCTYCHQNQLEFVGFGTEQIEEELQRYFGHLRIARLDTDVSRKKGQSQKILQDFRTGQLDLLVGTQMVAKGLNFERVKLVGVILADTSLNMPDFRAAERSFSLLVQVSGRAGRYSKGGKVLIQTYQPDSEVIQRAAALDWQYFYAKEMELRQLTHYPPFSRLIRLVFRGSDAAKVKAEAEQWHRHLQEAVAGLQSNAEDFAELFAPCECPYFRVANKYRYHLLLRSSKGHFSSVHHSVHRYFWQAKRSASVYVEVDVDPAAMM